MKTAAALALAVALAAATAGVGAGPASAGLYPCAPPPTANGATCAFDIWGYVLDSGGAPVAGVTVADGGPESITTTSSGYYHLVEPQAGTYTIEASTSESCYVRENINHGPLSGYVEGTRADFTLACAP